MLVESLIFSSESYLVARQETREVHGANSFEQVRMATHGDGGVNIISEWAGRSLVLTKGIPLSTPHILRQGVLVAV